MLIYDDLPIILVSAANKAAAAKIISDIIDNDVTEEVHLESANAQDRVWRITNKYYTADVRLQPFTDEDLPAQLPQHVDAHVLYLTEEECGDGARCAARAERAGAGAGLRRAHVRLAAAECGAPPAALLAAAARLRLELVPLREAPPAAADDDDEDEGEQRGAARVREALHAHAWRGLRRTDRSTHLPPVYAEESSSGSEDDEDDEEDEGEVAVERAEAFASMLGAVRDARAQCATMEPAERTRHAEALLAAFCRALGHRLDGS